MHNVRLGRRCVVAVVSVAVLAVAGCSSSGSGSSGGPASAAQPSTGSAAQPSSASSSGSDLAKLANEVKQAETQPSFSTYAADYGGKIKNVQSLRGKKVLFLPGDSQLAACTEIAHAYETLAEAVGMKVKIFANSGQTSQHNAAFEQAIDQHYDAIAGGCAMDPKTSAPAIAQAAAAGIPFTIYGASPAEAASGKLKIAAYTADTWKLDAKLAADQAVLQHKGKPFHALDITAIDEPVDALMTNELKSELQATCPKCTMTAVNVPTVQWSTNTATTVTSALLSHSDITVLFPHYAGMLTYVLKGIQAAHRTNDVTTYLNFGGGTPFIKLQTADPGKNIILGQAGGYPPWTGYLLVLQTARVLTGMKPLPISKAIGPNRLATPQNAAEILTTGGSGTGWVNGFRSLLGLPALSGKALTDASTLNGKMTAKPGK